MYGPRRMLKKLKWPLRGKRFPTPDVGERSPLSFSQKHDNRSQKSEPSDRDSSAFGNRTLVSSFIFLQATSGHWDVRDES